MNMLFYDMVLDNHFQFTQSRIMYIQNRSIPVVARDTITFLDSNKPRLGNFTDAPSIIFLYDST